MLTIILLLIPLIAAIIVAAAGNNNAAKTAFTLSCIQLLATVWVWINFNNSGGTQFLVDRWWIESLGISFRVGIDGISLLLIVLTNFLVPLIILSSFNKNYRNAASFYALILFMQFALVGVFVALDGFLFYIFWELALIPIYFICLAWGGENRGRITLKFFIYTLAGSLFMLLGLIYLYLQTPAPHSFEISALYNLNLSGLEQQFIFWAFFLAFAIKMPIFPLHTWQPDTYTVSPTPGTMLLSGIMLKMGVYGVIRWMLPISPLGMEEWGWLVILLSVIGIVYASCIALVQRDFKRLIAYSSIAHVGLIAAGIFALNIQGMQGGMIQMLSHGVNVVGLFLVADIIFTRTGTRQMSELGGISHLDPKFAVLFMIILLGSVALPLTNGFVGEFLLLSGVYTYNAWLALAAGTTVILGAVYMLRSYKAMMLGEKREYETGFSTLSGSEKTVLVVIAMVIIVTGIYPQPLLDVSAADVDMLLKNINTKMSSGI